METINLTSLNKNQLRSICQNKGLENYENLTNAQLKELIQTGKYTEVVKVEEVPAEPITQIFKINSHAVHTRKVVSINFIRSMVRDYCNFNNLDEDDKKELKITLPNGTVLHPSKLSFIAQSMKLNVKAVQLFIQDAGFGNKKALEKLNSFAKLSRNTNRLPIDWDVIGEKTKTPDVWLPLLKDALQLAVNEEEINNEEAQNITESFKEISKENNFEFTFKPLKIESNVVATTLID